MGQIKEIKALINSKYILEAIAEICQNLGRFLDYGVSSKSCFWDLQTFTQMPNVKNDNAPSKFISSYCIELSNLLPFLPPAQNIMKLNLLKVALEFSSTTNYNSIQFT